MDIGKVEKIRSLEGVKVRKAYDNKNLDRIIADCITENQYMNSCSFPDELLAECEILFRDGRESTSCSESNDFRNRICYIIRDIEGKIVGIQGRSTIDTDWKRNCYVMNDPLWKNAYWDSKWDKGIKKKHKKLIQKVINTAGFDKSNYLYLLHKYVNKTGDIDKIVIVEGLKDALRVYQQKLGGVAVVSIMGAEISSKQTELLQTVFGLDKQIILSLDGDDAGYQGSLNVYEVLKTRGFNNISFVLYPKINQYGFYYKDFGDITSPEMITATLQSTVDLDTYKAEMKDRVWYARAVKSIKEKEERAEYWETIKNDFIPCRKEDMPTQVRELFGIK
jgi:DNA primase